MLALATIERAVQSCQTHTKGFSTSQIGDGLNRGNTYGFENKNKSYDNMPKLGRVVADVSKSMAQTRKAPKNTKRTLLNTKDFHDLAQIALYWP